jgi:hypothetical protein
MSTYTLKFPSFEAAKAVAQALGFWNEGSVMPNGTMSEPTWKTGGQSIDPGTGEAYSWAIDVIGHIQTTPGAYDRSTFPPTVVTPPVYSPEFYVNVSGVLPPGAAVYLAPAGYGSAGRTFAEAEEVDPS